MCLKNLSNNKAPGPDRIPNSILKNMPQSFHKLLHLFFTHAINKNKSLRYGKTVSQYYYTKKATHMFSQIIDQLH